MKTLMSLLLVCGMALGLVTMLSVEGTAEDKKKAGSGAGKPYEFVAPLEVVMEQADAVFYGMEDKIKKKKFKKLKNEALFLAEMGNLYSHVKDHLENKQWQDFCSKLKGNSLKLSEAAEKKDGAKVQSLWSRVEETCDSCHEEFRD